MSRAKLKEDPEAMNGAGVKADVLKNGRAKPKDDDPKLTDLVKAVRATDPSMFPSPYDEVMPPHEFKRRPGRPSKYCEEYLLLAERACIAFGATDEELAVFLGISVNTVDQWKVDHPEFASLTKSGKLHADANVAVKLYHRAIGYTYQSEKIYYKDEKVVRVPVWEHVPPDVVAAIFWLKNRQPQAWKDRIEHTGAGGAPIKFESLTDQQLDVLIERIQKTL